MSSIGTLNDEIGRREKNHRDTHYTEMRKIATATTKR